MLELAIKNSQISCFDVQQDYLQEGVNLIIICGFPNFFERKTSGHNLFLKQMFLKALIESCCC